jgi:uncharacterized circularly permuted ATP-grasp superfamily protein
MTTPISSQTALGAPASARLPRLSARAAKELRLRVDRVVREMDTAYSLVTDESSRLEWSLNPNPLFIEAGEWDLIESAVAQRARVVNCLLKDLYSRQEVLQKGLVPANLILSDEAFRRPCVGLEPERAAPATVLRFDLVNSAKDGWLFTDTYANFPIGAAFAVQNRRSLLQERGELYASLPDYRRIIDYPIQLLDHLKRLSPRDKENPKMVVLTGGSRAAAAGRSWGAIRAPRSASASRRARASRASKSVGAGTGSAGASMGGSPCGGVAQG